MSNFPESQDFDFNPPQSTTVTLAQAEVDWAVQVSQSVADGGLQWQSFLRALALKGFHQWVEAGALDLAVYYDPDQVPTSGVNCRLGDFRLCLIAQGSLSDEVIPIPRETLDAPCDFAHLYVLVEVEEEVNQVTVLSGLRRDRILAHQQTFPLILNTDDTYTVPVGYFDTSPEDLLLYLNCLNPERLAEVPRSEVAPVTPVTPWAERASNLSRDMIRVSDWLQGQLGEVADRLSWTLLPPIQPRETALAFRSPEEEIDDILREVSTTVTLPATPTRGAFINRQQFDAPFRLYALTWELPASEPPEWSLLLVLCPSEGAPLPPGIQLQIRDLNSLLVEQTLAPDSESTYLFGQVIGTQDEPFFVSVVLPNGVTLHYPTFAF